MSEDPVCISLDMPVHLHHRLQEVAARQGCSVGQLILRSIEQVVGEARPTLTKRRLSLCPAIIPSRGKPITLTNDQIYDLIEFP